MPELPEVETFGRYFAKHALGQPIERVRVLDERILADIRKETFVRKLKGRTFTEVRRHGKHLFVNAGDVWLHLHFGMTGDLKYYRSHEEQPRFAKVIFDFPGELYLAFEDVRLFGLANIVDSPDEFIRERGLGPDPLELNYKRFAQLLEKRKGAIKSLLMTQEIIAGIGNLYADELLFQTSIHPRRAINRLKDAEKRALFNTMRRILRTAIERDLPPRSLFHHRDTDAPCPRCGGTIKKTVVFGRTTYYCASHQR